MDKIIQNVADSLPQFNDYLLRDFRKDQLNRSEDYMGVIFQEAVKLFRGEIKYLGSRVLPPEERTTHEISRGLVNIKTSEWCLYEFSFEHEGLVYKTPIYLPYLHNKMIVINDTTYSVMLAIGDKVFTKIKNGVTCRVIRSPINFWRNSLHIMDSLTSKECYFESLVTTKIHNKSTRKKKNKITVIHYLLVKYDLLTVLKIFDIKPDELMFVDTIDGSNTDKYEYFEARAKTKSSKGEIFMRVDKSIMNGDKVHKRRVVACLLYLLQNHKKHTIADLYDPSKTIYKIMLGQSIRSAQTPDAMALNYIENHLDSLDTYLDPINKNRLAQMGIFVNDIYDLLIYIFLHIDEMSLDSHSDLYDKRIDVMDNLYIPTLVTAIYYKFYNFENRKKNQSKQIKKLLHIPAGRISGIYSSNIVRLTPSIYNGNWLLSTGGKKIRQSGLSNKGGLNAPEQRFHPSFAVVETLIAFSQNNPGSAGTINPFLQIDDQGSIIKPDYASKVDSISKFLPYK